MVGDQALRIDLLGKGKVELKVYCSAWRGKERGACAEPTRTFIPWLRNLCRFQGFKAGE
jgi:hypothetical protein